MTDATYEARVISFPGSRGLTAVRRTAASAASQQLSSIGAGAVDDWGRDPALVRATARLGRLRWNTLVGGQHHLPSQAGALIVVNNRRFALSAAFAAVALSESTGRPVRFVGRSDVAPLGALARRLAASSSVPTRWPARCAPASWS